MSQSGTWNITPDHGNRNTIEVTASGFDFPGKNAIRYRIMDGKGTGATPLVTVIQTDTNSMTRAAGTLTIVLDSNIASLPDFSSIWTTLSTSGYFHQLDIRNSSGEDYHKVFGGKIDFRAVGADGTTSASASFTYSDGATSTAITVALGDSKKHNFVATAAPTVNDDTDGGYSVGSWWFNVTADRAYVCLDNTDGAAVWHNYADLDTAQEFTKTQNFNATSLTSTSNSIAWDAESNQVFAHTATENTTLANPTNLKDGATYILIYTQHASSAKTLAFGSVFKWPAGTAPTVSTGANAVDVMTFISDGTSMYGVASQNFS